MRKKVVLTAFLALLAGLPLAAQIPLLDKVEGHRVHFHYTYSLSRDGGPFRRITDGDVVLEDNAYRLAGLGLEVVSDGSTRCTLDPDARELVLETVEKEDLFTNPALFVSSYKQYMDKLTVNSAGEDSLDVTLVLDETTCARFLLTEVVYSPRQGKSDFTVEVESLPENYVITDLR